MKGYQGDIQKILSSCQIICVALCKGQRYCWRYRAGLFFKRMGKKAYIQCHYRDKKLPVHEYPQRLSGPSKTWTNKTKARYPTIDNRITRGRTGIYSGRRSRCINPPSHRDTSQTSTKDGYYDIKRRLEPRNCSKIKYYRKYSQIHKIKGVSNFTQTSS